MDHSVWRLIKSNNFQHWIFHVSFEQASRQFALSDGSESPFFYFSRAKAREGVPVTVEGYKDQRASMQKWSIFRFNVIIAWRECRYSYNKYNRRLQLLHIRFTPQSVTTKEGNGFKTETTLAGDLKAIRVYEFTDTGMVVVSAIPINSNVI